MTFILLAVKHFGIHHKNIPLDLMAQKQQIQFNFNIPEHISFPDWGG